MHIKILLLIFMEYSSGARILVIPGSPNPSHVKSMHPLSEVLAQNGHQVTMLQMIQYDIEQAKPPSNTKVEYKTLRIPLQPGDTSEPAMLTSPFFWKKPPFGGVSFMFPWYRTSVHCKKLLDNEHAKLELYRIGKNEHWDLVIVDDIFAPCGMLVAVEAKKSCNASVITFGTSILVPQSQEARGLPLNKALYPSALKGDGIFDHTDFMHRLLNSVDFGIFHWVVTAAIDYLVPYWLNLPRGLATVPSQFAMHGDLLMASLSPLIEFSKPMVRDIIELDRDCPARSPLSDKYQNFVEDPQSKGTIVFAMGHATDWDSAPAEVTLAYLEAFEKLSDYRIIWQYVTKKTKPKVPSHVVLDSWVPQAALLYHPKTKLFISHVGGKSLCEAICAGVPVVAMPMFAEQYRNTAILTLKKLGSYLGEKWLSWLSNICIVTASIIIVAPAFTMFAFVVPNDDLFSDKTQLSPHKIFDTINEILNNSMYSRNMRKLRDHMADQVIPPMELGRFWSEFLIRHKSDDVQKYLRMKWSKLNAFAASNTDMVLISVLASFIMLFLVW